MNSKNLSTHPEVIRFLSQVCGPIRSQERRVQVRDEILSHLEAVLAENSHRQGANFEERLQGALENFGDPAIFGRNLYVASRTWPQTMLKYLLSAVVASLALAYLSSFYFISHYQGILNTSNAVVASRVPRFETAQKDLARFKIFTETTAVKADAGEFLNSKIKWEGYSQRAEINIPEVSDPRWSHEWLTARIPEPLRKVGLSWISKLHSYYHWDLFKFGPVAELMKNKSSAMNPYAFPIPNFNLITQAIKVHLRLALERKEVTSALQDVRHLARLAYTPKL